MASFSARIGSVPSISNVGPYKMGQPLYELPGVLHASSGERFLDDLDGIDCQGEIGGDGEHLFVDHRATGVWRGNVVLLRSHAFTL